MGVGKFRPPGLRNPGMDFDETSNTELCRGHDNTLKSMWHCDEVGGLGEHVTFTCFGFFWRPFVKRFVRCQSCLSVTLVYCGQTVGWTKMKLGMELGLVPDHILLDGDSAPLAPKRTTAATLFSAHVYCGQAA